MRHISRIKDCTIPQAILKACTKLGTIDQRTAARESGQASVGRPWFEGGVGSEREENACNKQFYFSI